MKLRRNGKEYQRLRGDSGHHRRILGITIALGILAFIPVGLRLYILMIRDYNYYAELALQNQTRSTKVLADRGTIYDRNMEILACSKGVENLYLNPRELKQSSADIQQISEFLGGVLKTDPEKIRKKAKDDSYRYQQIAARIGEDKTDVIRDYIHEHHISGIHLEPNTQRFYPHGELASQVLGFTNASNAGSEGIEAAYDKLLNGTAGSVITTKGNNEMDMPFSYERYMQSRQGCSLILTLDTTVQACLEKQMKTAIARYDVQNGAFGLVMNVNTGEILAMATMGNYDPNQYLELADPLTAQHVEELKLQYMLKPENSPEYQKGKEIYQSALTEARLKQWRNRTVSDGYEPGSTFKVLTMAAALDCGAIDLNTDFYCRGSEHIPGRSQLLHCWRSTGHGAEKTPQALQNSCNIAFAHIALKMGGEQFYDYIQRFGVTEKTGIDLAGESKGIFFDKELVTNTEKWGTASLTSGSFGQTFKVTPIQLVRAIASVVNGGNLMEPYVVSEAIDKTGKTVYKQEPTVIRKTIQAETSAVMCRLLESVVTEGTAKNANVFGYSMGGKTGTSEKIDVFDENGQLTKDKIVSFVGVAPMDNPEYIVLVALDTPSRSSGIYISGGVMAAPTVGAVMADILPYLGVERNFTPEDAAGRLVVLDDFSGMTADDAAHRLKEQLLNVRFIGQGETVSGQIPAPGQSVPGDSQILLYLGENPAKETRRVPNFSGMNRQQAADTAGQLGLYLLISGNNDLDPAVRAIAQSVPAGTEVDSGTTIALTFSDTRMSD